MVHECLWQWTARTNKLEGLFPPYWVKNDLTQSPVSVLVWTEIEKKKQTWNVHTCNNRQAHINVLMCGDYLFDYLWWMSIELEFCFCLLCLDALVYSTVLITLFPFCTYRHHNYTWKHVSHDKCLWMPSIYTRLIL